MHTVDIVNMCATVDKIAIRDNRRQCLQNADVTGNLEFIRRCAVVQKLSSTRLRYFRISQIKLTTIWKPIWTESVRELLSPKCWQLLPCSTTSMTTHAETFC